MPIFFAMPIVALKRLAGVFVILAMAAGILSSGASIAKADIPSGLVAAASVGSGTANSGACDQNAHKMMTTQCKAMCGLHSVIIPFLVSAQNPIATALWAPVGSTWSTSNVKPDHSPPRS
jgi:hypothetical protein